MGATPQEAGSAIRVSLGWTSTSQEVERFCDAWAGIYDRLASGRRAIA
jgi:cysteine desulfurase